MPPDRSAGGSCERTPCSMYSESEVLWHLVLAVLLHVLEARVVSVQSHHEKQVHLCCWAVSSALPSRSAAPPSHHRYLVARNNSQVFMHPDRTRKLHNVHIQTRQQQNYTNDKDSHLFCGEKQFTRVYSSSRTHRRDEALLDYVAEEYGGSVELTVGVPYCGKKIAQHAREDVTTQEWTRNSNTLSS